MTATTISQTEGTPESYADDPYLELSDEAQAVDQAMLWQRLESYIAWRFSPRAVTWVVEGPGDWQPPLKPAEVETVEEWRGGAWVETTLDPSPLGGFILTGCGPYRFAAEVGAGLDPVPAAVVEAFKRLAEYMAAVDFDKVGIRSENVPGVWQGEYGSPSWRARALQDSGAADLLRAYRRA